MAGPTKQFDQTLALGQALSVFWKQGFEATSMQDLVQHMGINRASMYQTYGNKHALFLAAIDRYIEASLMDLEQMLQAEGPQLTNLQSMFERIIEQSLQGQMAGCLINNSAVELGPHDEEVRDKVRQFWAQLEQIFQQHLQMAIDRKELKPSTNPQAVSSLLNSTFQGLVVKTKVAVSQQQLNEDITEFFSLIQLKYQA